MSKNLKFSYDINFKVGAVLSKIKDGKKKAQLYLDTSLVRLSNDYIPFRTGELQNSIDKTGLGKGFITYKAPYARAAYYGINSRGKEIKFHKTFHKYAQKEWLHQAYHANHRMLEENIEKKLGSKL